MGENATNATRSLCPVSVSRGLPVSTLQTRSVLSAETATRLLPSGDHAGALFSPGNAGILEHLLYQVVRSLTLRARALQLVQLWEQT